MEYNKPIFAALFLLAAGALAEAAPVVSLAQSKADAYLFALGQIESAGNDHAKGRAGEISRYQALKRVWREATEAPYSSATNPAVAERVVLCIIWNRLGKDINDIKPGEFAKAWHCPNAKRLNKEQRDYIKRFKNLCKKQN